jgi:hypothetical protein
MNSFTSSFSNEVKAVLLTLLILAFADLGLRLTEVKLSIDVRHIRSFPEIAHELSAGPAPRVLFLGNSLTRHGVDPQTWATALEKLGAPRGAMAKLVPDDTTMPDWYYVSLNNLVRRRERPDMLILGFALNQLTDERIEASRLGAYFCDFGNLRELFAKDLKGVGAKGDFLLGRLCRIYGVRDELQSRFGSEFIPGYQEGVRRLNGILQRRTPRRKVQTSVGKVHSYELLDRALTLWRAQGIEVVLVAMPIPSGYEIDPAVVMKAKSAGVRLIDARQLPALTREDFPDGYHMGPKAAETYTRFVAENLAEGFREHTGRVRVAARGN